MWPENAEVASWRGSYPGLEKMGWIPGEASGRKAGPRAEAGGKA